MSLWHCQRRRSLAARRVCRIASVSALFCVGPLSSAFAQAGEDDSAGVEASAEMDAEATAELPPIDPESQRPRPVTVPPAETQKRRLFEVGAVIAGVVRPGETEGLGYDLGYGFGGYIRPELQSWLGIRLYYRQEWLPVNASEGGFDYGDDSYGSALSQPDLEVANFGLLLEPTWVVHPRLRLFGAAGAGWVQITAPAPEGEDFDIKADRHAIEVNVLLGAGVIFDIVPDWMTATFSLTHGFSVDQRGSAYEPLQAVVDGSLVYLAPLPKPTGMTDLSFSLGVVF